MPLSDMAQNQKPVMVFPFDGRPNGGEVEV